MPSESRSARPLTDRCGKCKRFATKGSIVGLGEPRRHFDGESGSHNDYAKVEKGVLARQGYAGMTLQDVAYEIGIYAASIYYQFCHPKIWSAKWRSKRWRGLEA